jgi:copper chaperone NosL
MALLLMACESRPRGPMPIRADDACASCRMAISERRYAAELLDHDGNLYKFDDIACMLRFAHSLGAQRSAIRFYVTDYANGEDFIDASSAYFVRLKSSVSSPMASGIVAFRNAATPAQASNQKNGGAFTFDELWAKDMNEVTANRDERLKR